MADIPINEVTRRVQFTGNTGTGPFAFTFNILVDDDLIVYKNFVLQTITTDYTVSTNANGTGSITMTSALVASDVLTIIGGRALERTTDFVTAGDLLASSLNEQLDSLVIMAQQLDEKLDRSVKVDIGDQFTDLSLPAKADRLGTVLAFNATSGDPEAGPTIADTQSVADISADIATLADIQDGTTDTNVLTNLNGIRTDVTTVSGISANVTTVANNDANVTTVATNLNGSDTIGTVAGSIANVNLTGSSITSVNTVAGSITNVNTTATNIADVNTVAGVSTDVSTVAGISSNVSTVSGISANVTTVAGISSNVTTVAGISGNVTTVAGQTTNLQNVTDNLTAIQNAATNATNAATSATNAATSATAAAASQTAAAASAASAASSYDSFDDRYLGVKASDPTVDNDGDPLSSGLLYFSSSENIMKVYDGASWIAATSAGNVSLTTYQYTATSGQTTFSGADDNAATLSYTVNNILVTLNGSLLFNGTDYTATTGTSVVLTSGATTSDVLQVTAFASFTTADMVPASTGGTFSGNVAITGDLTIDTNTLYVDSANNRVGVGTSSPSGKLTLKAGDNTYAGGFRLEGTDETTALAITHVNGDNYFSGNATDDHLVLTGSGNVGIGTSSPERDVTTTSLAVSGGGSKSASLDLYGTVKNYAIYSGGSGQLGFYNLSDSTERMRIDSSGNLLVGTTSTGAASGGSGTSGININASGAIEVARSANPVMFVNRTTSDGDIMQFRKDGTTVGSIGNNSTNLTINGVGALELREGGTTRAYVESTGIHPWVNNTYDLGTSGSNWKDLYLSGGVYLGGTGAANKLDDYEEGTWTPTIKGGTSAGTGTYGVQDGKYTIVGNTVFISAYITWTAHTGTGIMIFSLPFTPGAGALRYSSVSIGYADNLAWGSGSHPSMHIHPSTNQLFLGSSNVSGSWSNSNVDSAGGIIFSGHYYLS